MGVRHTVHIVEPQFFRAAARSPELLGWWLGFESDDLGIDPQRFVSHPTVRALAGDEGLGNPPSIDDGTSLDQALPAIVFLLNRTFSDEPEAWAALEGTGSSEFPVTPLGEHAFGLDPVSLRRVAGLLEVLPNFEVMKAYDAELLNSANVYPQSWQPADALNLEETFMRLRLRLSAGAEMAHALVMAVDL